jgi:hypothetical protein
MIGVSTALMFLLTYLTTYSPDHLYFNETRLYMSLIMGAAMAVVMLLFMHGMYEDKGKNLVIVVACACVFALSLWLVRSQARIDDVAYMKAMIPHHSIAILTSRRAQIRDPRVRKLADGIIEAQVREIGEMERLVAELEAHPLPADSPLLEAPAKAR